ncbi:MAG: hypothetical protein Unbinned2716contig1004_3 [Prokaryotic dsDNA virus sp.]|nr:MAG: hypothetical protein Unbinned2716contig1004_3 [Prokaryotic dsDNA virus sp.]|tara:strand:+ start:9063 stop:11843 length:2781 start_codon:yes stop_codon:yes gene_type:complete
MANYNRQNRPNVSNAWCYLCDHNFPYGPVNYFDPRYDVYISYSFKEGQRPQSIEDNQAMLALLDDSQSTVGTSSSLIITPAHIMYGTGATNCNTDNGSDDWGKLTEEDYGPNNDINGDGNFGGQADFGHIVNSSTDYLEIETGAGFGANNFLSNFGLPYFMSFTNASQQGVGNIITPQNEIYIPPAWVVDVILDSDDQWVKSIIVRIPNAHWANLFREEGAYGNLMLSAYIGQGPVDTDLGTVDVNYLIDKITGRMGYGNSEYPANIPFGVPSAYEIPYDTLVGQRVSLGFKMRFGKFDDQAQELADYNHYYTALVDPSADPENIALKNNILFGTGSIPNYQVTMGSFELPREVPINENVIGSFNLNFQDFEGVARVLVVDNQHVDSEGIINQLDNDMRSIYDQLEVIGFNYIDDAANYGIVEFDYETDSLGVRFDVHPVDLFHTFYFTYTGVASGADSFSVYVQLISSNHGNDSWNDYFNEIPPAFKWFRVHNTNIDVVAESDEDDDSDMVIDPSEDDFDIVDDDEVIIPPETEDDYEPDPNQTLILNPVDICFHFLEQELKYADGIDAEAIIEARDNHLNWRFDFVINERDTGKNHIQDLVSNMKSSPTFNNNKLSWFNIKTTYTGDEPKITITSKDIISYEYSRTDASDVKTSIEVKYNYDIGLDSYLSTTGDLKVNDAGGGIFEGVYHITRPYADMPNYDMVNPEDKINYYGVKTENGSKIIHEDTHEIIETKYITDPYTASEFAKFQLTSRCNVHNKITLTLPLKYYYLEVGDLVDFDAMIKGRKLFGEKYVLDKPDEMPIRCGQFILPLFIITDVKKTLKNVTIELYQLHHLDYETAPVYNGFEYQLITPTGFLPDVPDFPDLTPAGTGDLNGDGSIDVLDVVLVMNLILDGEYNEAGDLNGDGQLDVLDIVMIVNVIIG